MLGLALVLVHKVVVDAHKHAAWAIPTLRVVIVAARHLHKVMCAHVHGLRPAAHDVVEAKVQFVVSKQLGSACEGRATWIRISISIVNF